ncbi:MAG: flavin reductase family protein [Candidatus Aenigmatarchaeota archaeon]
MTMKKVKILPTAFADETSRALENPGCLLVSGDASKANVMTIGWGAIGVLWGKPVFMVAVRPSRHTYALLERTGEFTVNLPRKGMEATVAYCGAVSGRDVDKFKEKHLTKLPGEKVRTPIIAECGVHYECRVLWKTKVDDSVMPVPDDVKKRFYPKGDLHTVYFGEIVAARADDDASESLAAVATYFPLKA